MDKKKSLTISALTILVLAIIFSVSLVSAATLTVISTTQFTNQTGNVVTNTTAGPIQGAIDASNPGDSIRVDAGVYANSINITKVNNITIYSQSGAASTTISNNSDIVVRIGNLSGGTNIILDGFSINSTRNGTETPVKTISYGVVIYQSNVTIKNSVFNNNNISIHVDSTTTNITLGSITNNTFSNMTSGGGAILLQTFFNNISGITISKNTFSHINITNYGINITGNNTIPNVNALTNYTGDTFDITIDSNFINATKYGITVYNVTSITITNNNITNISKNGVEIVTLRTVQRLATNLYNHTITIQNNNVSGSGVSGISMCSSLPGYYNTTTTKIDENIFSANNVRGITYACTDKGTTMLNATNNYWGDISGPSNETDSVGVIASLGTSADGNITYIPWYQDGVTSILHSIVLSGTHYNTIQNAIENASAGATITVGAGIYKNRWVNITKNNGIVLNASQGATVTTIMFNTTNVIEIGNLTGGANVIIDGFTINSTCGNYSLGYLNCRGILIRQSNFTIKNSVFNNNNVSIYVDSTITNITLGSITNNTFSNMTSGGGAILLEAFKNISGITISKNTLSHLNISNYGINITGNNTIPNVNALTNYTGDTFGITIDSNFINATKYGITVYNVTSITITNNNITNISKNGIEIVTLRAVQKLATNLYNHTITIQTNNVSRSGSAGIHICSSGAGFYNTTTTTISSNIITNNSLALTYACTDATKAALDAANNWWGHIMGPGNESLNKTGDNSLLTNGVNSVNGNVTYLPYYKDANRTILSRSTMVPISNSLTTTLNYTGISVNDSLSGATITVPRATLNVSLEFGYFLNSTGDANVSMPINVSVNTTSGVVVVQIAANTTFAGTPGIWLGTFNLPAVSSSNVSPTVSSGYGSTTSATYEMGYSENLTITARSNAVRINFTNQGTKSVGYVRNSAFTAISAACNVDSQSAGNNLTNWTGNCKITGGNDLIVWTKHFSQFILYNQSALTTASTTTSSSSGGGSAAVGTAATTWTMTYIAPEEKLSTGYTKELKTNERVKVSVGGGTHHVGVKSLTTSSAVIEIASDPVSVSLDVGEDAKVDVNSDGTYDLYVKLNAIANSKADVTIKSISETIPEGEGAVTTSGEVTESAGTTTGGEGETEVEKSNLTWLWIVIGIVVVLAIIGVSVKKRK